jgi:tRNA (guanine10-N2)-dimethyltransferase
VYVLVLAGEDDRLPARECAAAATDVTVVAPGLATARGIDPGRFRGLAYAHAASELVARTDADVAAARRALAAAPLDREGTVAVRARDVRGAAGVSTSDAERELGAALVERGSAVDLEAPDHELRALFSGDVCLLGWLAVESVRDFADRAPTDKPFFQPGSMDPMLARALVNVAGARPGATLLDPMCGTGGVLVEAGLVGADVLGVDAQRKMVRGAARNLRQYLDGNRADDDRGPRTPAPGEWHLLRGDATRLPLPDGAADAAVFDVPYGRQSRIEEADEGTLTADALAEARRVAPRAVVVADRSLADPAAAADWSVADRFERRVHRSLVRHVHVLE